MVVAAGVPVTIMLYGAEDNSGVLITCSGSGSEDTPPLTMGEKVGMALLGGFTMDVLITEPSALGEVEDLIRKDFGDKVVHPTMQAIKIHARTLGFPLD